MDNFVQKMRTVELFGKEVPILGSYTKIGDEEHALIKVEGGIFGKYINQGSECTVWEHAEDATKILKVYKLGGTGLRDRTGKVFPDCITSSSTIVKEKFIGVVESMKREGWFYLVTELPKLNIINLADVPQVGKTEFEIVNKLLDEGWSVRIPTTAFVAEKDGVFLVDIRAANVATDKFESPFLIDWSAYDSNDPNNNLGGTFLYSNFAKRPSIKVDKNNIGIIFDKNYISNGLSCTKNAEEE